MANSPKPGGDRLYVCLRVTFISAALNLLAICVIEHTPTLYHLPVDLLLKQQFNYLQKIKSVRIPVLFIHGTYDPQIPAEISQTLFAAAQPPQQLILIPKAGHDSNMQAPYYQAISSEQVYGKCEEREVES